MLGCIFGEEQHQDKICEREKLSHKCTAASKKLYLHWKSGNLFFLLFKTELILKTKIKQKKRKCSIFNVRDKILHCFFVARWICDPDQVNSCVINTFPRVLSAQMTFWGIWSHMDRQVLCNIFDSIPAQALTDLKAKKQCLHCEY